MRLDEISSKDIWYHGTGLDFEAFDADKKRFNRTTNPKGIYLTKDEDLARDYAARAKKESGKAFVYECELEVFNPWYEDKSPITKPMIEEYINQLVRNTNYDEEWARKYLAKEFVDNHRMKFDLDGEIKTAVYQAGGFDSYFFNDMGTNVIVVFDPNDIIILNKFQPQELVKDPEIDAPAKEINDKKREEARKQREKEEAERKAQMGDSDPFSFMDDLLK